MPRISSVEKAGPKVIKHFKELKQTVFLPSDLASTLEDYRSSWNLAPSTKPTTLISFLVKKEVFRKVHLKFPNERNYTRYLKSQFSDFELALSLVAKSYLSHYSAVQYHQLTEQIPKTIFINKEQTPKPQTKSPLIQANIDRAFTNNPRRSNNTGTFDDKTITVLSGKSTRNFGVIKDKDGLHVTNIERTLVDCVVRPMYSGGPHEILKAYQNAQGRFSVNKLLATLKKLGLIYPYHQTIGFLLEKCEASEQELAMVEKLPIEYNYYFTHKMTETSFSERWKLFYPKSFD